MRLDGKILVTGADGFIGSHLVEALLARGHDVRAFVMYNFQNTWGWLDTLPPDLRRELDVFAGDIRDPHGVREAMRGCRVVMHLAALISIPFSYHSPAAYVETNVTGTLNLLQAARNLGVDRFVQTSTSEVYGTARYAPMDEAHPLQAQSPYAASKIAADQLALSFYRSFETPVAVIRPFNTYGPRQSARAVIPTIIAQALSGARSIRLGSLHPTRDFNHVADTVRAFLCVAESDGALGRVVNAGGAVEVSIGELAETIIELTGAECAITADHARVRPKDSEVERLCCDATLMGELTGHAPEYAGSQGLTRGLGETIDWFREPGVLERYKPERYNV